MVLARIALQSAVAVVDSADSAGYTGIEAGCTIQVEAAVVARKTAAHEAHRERH